MKAILALLLILGQASQPSPQPKSCVIVAIHKKTVGDFNRWTVVKPFDYVEGDFPSGIKFRSEISDKTVREIKEKGGKVVVMKSDYALPDLEDARKTCKEFQGLPK